MIVRIETTLQWDILKKLYLKPAMNCDENKKIFRMIWLAWFIELKWI